MTTISRFHRIFYDFLISVKLPSLYAEVLNLVLLTVLVFIVATILNYFFKNSISKIFKSLSKNTKTNFDDYLIENKTPVYIAKLVPVFFIYKVIPFWFFDFEMFIEYAFLALEVYLVFLSVWIVKS